jgi:hypothetical protein
MVHRVRMIVGSTWYPRKDEVERKGPTDYCHRAECEIDHCSGGCNPCKNSTALLARDGAEKIARLVCSAVAAISITSVQARNCKVPLAQKPLLLAKGDEGPNSNGGAQSRTAAAGGPPVCTSGARKIGRDPRRPLGPILDGAGAESPKNKTHAAGVQHVTPVTRARAREAG